MSDRENPFKIGDRVVFDPDARTIWVDLFEF